MQDPEREIRDIIQRLTTTKDIETQTAALHDYFTEDASYDHAMVQIPAGPGSRDRLQGCYRFYKAAVKNIKIDIKDVFYHKDKMVVDLVETLTPRFMPWRRFDMRLIVVLYLRQDAENKKYYIYRQEDIFQTHDLAKFIPLGGQALWLWKGFGAYCGFIMSYGTKALGIF